MAKLYGFCLSIACIASPRQSYIESTDSLICAVSGWARHNITGVVQITVQSYNTKNRGTYRRMVWLVVWSIWHTRHGWTAGIVVYSIILDNMLNLTQTQESYRNSKQGQHVEESHHIWPAHGWICLSRICNRKWLNAGSELPLNEDEMDIAISASGVTTTATTSTTSSEQNMKLLYHAPVENTSIPVYYNSLTISNKKATREILNFQVLF